MTHSTTSFTRKIPWDRVETYQNITVYHKDRNTIDSWDIIIEHGKFIIE